MSQASRRHLWYFPCRYFDAEVLVAAGLAGAEDCPLAGSVDAGWVVAGSVAGGPVTTCMPVSTGSGGG